MAFNNSISANQVDEAVSRLKQGELIVLPTDTIYALSCDASNQCAVQKIFNLKNRDENKSLPILVADLEEAQKYVIFNKQAKKLARNFWPGALTMVLPYNRGGTRIFVNAQDQEPGSIGIRVPKHDLVIAILQKLARPLIGTSANLSGIPLGSSYEKIVSTFRSQIKLIIKTDTCSQSGQESTIVTWRNDELVIIRRGAISEKHILACI